MVILSGVFGKANNITHAANDNAMQKRTTSDAVKGCLQDDPHSCPGDARSQPVSFAGCISSVSNWARCGIYKPCPNEHPSRLP